MCNFELSPEQFRQRRIEMIALADQRRLARAVKPARARRGTVRRRLRVPLGTPVALNPAPVVR
jgi:class 3 adenylate cyclase